LQELLLALTPLGLDRGQLGKSGRVRLRLIQAVVSQSLLEGVSVAPAAAVGVCLLLQHSLNGLPHLRTKEDDILVNINDGILVRIKDIIHQSFGAATGHGCRILYT
jgi:hypothetical protein